MEKKFNNIERRGLPGGPNEQFSYITGVFSTEGYKSDSPDVNNPFNIIDSGNITMKGVDFPVLGTDNLGNSQMMFPENDYQFPGNQVTELPMGGLGGPIKSIIQAAVKKFPAIQKAIGKNYDEAVEYFSSNIDEFKNYLRSYTDEAESILPGPATTEISPTLKLPFNQRGQIIPQQHMTSGKHSTNAGEALDHIYGDGPMWFAPTGDTRYINTSTNLPFVSGSGKPIQRSYTDFIGNTGKQGFDEFPLTEKEKLTKSFGGYYGKIVDGEYVADLDNPIMRSQLRVLDGMQNKIEGVFDPNIKIKVIDGKPSKLGHSLEGNWDGTKIGQFQDEGYDVIQVINEFTGDQLENILLPNSKHKFKVTKIDDMPVQIDNPEFKYGGRFMQDAGEIGNAVIFAESPVKTKSKYNVFDKAKNLPPELIELQNKFKGYEKQLDILYNSEQYEKGANKYLQFLRKRNNDLNDEYNNAVAELEGFAGNRSEEEKAKLQERIKDLDSKYNENINVLFSEEDKVQLNYDKEIDRVRKLSRQANRDFHFSDLNPKSTAIDSTFYKEAENLKKVYAKLNPNSKVDIINIDGNADLIRDGVANLDPNDSMYFFGHSGNRLGGVPNEEIAEIFAESNADNCYLGSCNFKDEAAPYRYALPGKNLQYRGKGAWWGVNPNANSIEDAMWGRVTNPTTVDEEGSEYTTGGRDVIIVKPEEGKDYNKQKVKTLPKGQDGIEVRPQATISQYEEPAWYEKAGDYLANPFTSFGYSARGEDIPDGLDVSNPNRNNFDMVVDILNPFAWYQYAENAAQNLKDEEYLNATFNTLGALPFIPASSVAAKNLKTPLQKIAANTSRSMSNANANVKGGISSIRPNWSKWNKEIPNNKPLMEEYSAIEKIGKADGTWMKNPDGSMFKGTPEQWVQIRSSNYKKAFPNALLDDSGSPLINYHGSGSKFDVFDESKFYSGEYGKGVYTSPDKEAILRSYANPNKNRTKKIAGKSGTDKPTANLYELYINANSPLTTDDIIDYRNFGKIMDNLPSLADWKASDLGKRMVKENQWLKTDEAIMDFIKRNFPNNPVKETFIDQGGDFLRAIDSPLQEGVTPFSNQMKSSIGNNGMFDITNPNIYKQKGGESLEEYQDKGEVKKTYNPFTDLDKISEGRRTELTNAINFIVDNQGGDKNLRDLLTMTAFMENSYGANPDAYGRDYTRGPMSIDDVAFKHMFEIRKGANDYTKGQKKYIDWFKGMGYDLENMDKYLRDDIKANVAAARYQYGTNKNPLPSSDNPQALYDYYMDTYNRTGEDHYDRFLEGYNQFVKKKKLGGASNNYSTYVKYINGDYTGNQKNDAEKVYDKLNRIHYRDAKQLGMSPQNYIMTNLQSNS